MDVLSRARKYLDRCPPAVSGQGGHDAAYRAAVALVHGFCLDFANAMALMTEWNGRCQPPWSDQELHHKVRDALEKSHDKPRGFLLGEERRSAPAPFKAGRSLAVLGTLANSLGPKGIQKAKEDIKLSYELPAPIEDGACELLKAAFNEGEGVRIVPARINDDGKEIPDGTGPCLSREEWLKRLQLKGGNPNGIWKSDDRTGIYVGLNPLRIGGSKDEDVTAYRHVLVEFDKSLSIEEQWNLYYETKLPCTAIIFSGNQSLHAWVRVDARDLEEYNERVQILWDYFALYGIDPKNKNPSRLSRLPNCVRFDKRQELWALTMGAPNFEMWIADLHGKSIGDLKKPEPDASNELIRHRFLNRRAAMLLVGATGLGKSSLAQQMAVMFALGKPCFGFEPTRPLRSFIIQAENDEGDLAETRDDIYKALALTENEREMVAKNVFFATIDDSYGLDFLHDRVRPALQARPSDLLWLDPLFAFVGGDVSKQEVMSPFLRGGLNPILRQCNCGAVLVHHPPKPPRENNFKQQKKFSDHAYAGYGSVELANWPRAVVNLESTGRPGVFQLVLGKRGGRAGWKESDGKTRAYVRFIAHGKDGIYWRDAEKEEQAIAASSGTKDDVLPLVPLDGSIDKNALISKLKSKSFGETRARGYISELVNDGVLFEWIKKRPKSPPSKAIARKPQELELNA